MLPWLTVAGNIRLAVDAAHKGSMAVRQAEVDHHIKMVGLSHATDRRPPELSSEMRQRVAVALALAMRPKVMLVDEQLSALDAMTRANVASEIKAIWLDDKRTAVMITNDVVKALILADRILCLNPDGTLGQEFVVSLPSPRNRDAPDAGTFKVLRAEVTAYLMKVGIKSKLPETRLVSAVTPRHAIPGAYTRAAAPLY